MIQGTTMFEFRPAMGLGFPFLTVDALEFLDRLERPRFVVQLPVSVHCTVLYTKGTRTSTEEEVERKEGDPLSGTSLLRCKEDSQDLLNEMRTSMFPRFPTQNNRLSRVIWKNKGLEAVFHNNDSLRTGKKKKKNRIRRNRKIRCLTRNTTAIHQQIVRYHRRMSNAVCEGTHVGTTATCTSTPTEPTRISTCFEHG